MGNNPVNYVDPTGHWAQVAVLALAGAVLKAGFYAATHESSNTQDYWYEVGKAALTGATTALGVAADPAGAAVGAGIGFVNAAIHGELPDKLETGADWYQLVDALTGFNTAIGAAGGFGLQNFDQAAAGIGSEALKEVAALWGSLTTAQKVAIGTAALTALSGVTPTAGQSSSSTGGTNSSPGGGGPIKATAN